MTSSANKWFSRVTSFDQSLLCPRCEAPYVAGPIFDHHDRVCNNCHTTLNEWNMISVVYLIDVENAPDIIKHIINYLQPFTEPDAFEELLSLFQFLHVEEIVSLYTAENSTQN